MRPVHSGSAPNVSFAVSVGNLTPRERVLSKAEALTYGSRSKEVTPLAPPDGLRLSTLFEGAEELAILSYPAATSSDEETSLTPAERAVLKRVVVGDSNVEIGRLRGTSHRTVANQIAVIFRKLGVTSRWELVARARGSNFSG